MSKDISIEEVMKINKDLARKKYDKYEKYLDKFENFSNKKQVDVLWQALGYMQQYNGRSYNDCIVLGMGGTMDDINDHILRES